MLSYKNVLLLMSFLIIGLMTGCASSKSAQVESKDDTASAKENSQKENGLKPYSEIITDEAESSEGLFDVHKIDEKYYYEIPDSLLNREMLLVSRISKTPANLGYGGQKLNTQVVRWQKKGDNILLRHVSFSNVASDSLPIKKAVDNSNLEPIIASLAIKSLAEDSAGSVVEVTNLYTTDIPSLGLQSYHRQRYQVRRLDVDRTFVNYIRSFPENIEVRKLLTYQAQNPPSSSSTGTISVEINHSMVLLPQKPMKPRQIDRRVGYFSVGQTDYGTDAQKAKQVRYATRYKLVPSDKEAYLNGDLVEPVEPIVYYIDSATPQKWRSYLKKGIEDWQKAFEAAGFKDAIIAKDAPTTEVDSTFSPEDVRYSVIRYFASQVQNASGPHVHDPRSGQILESDINWYHNIMNLLRNWYFVQTAAVNPAARGVEFDDEIMGDLIRFVAAHEVGHTLGLRHNFGSSSAYPVDSLRSSTFTDSHGTAPSIMDYARFNYIAQPEDGVSSFYPQIGKYDKWAIKWAYSWFPEDMTTEEIRKKLNEWVVERADDPVYFFGDGSTDPRSQTEDLGDNTVKASEYGIANLKRITDNLVQWTHRSGETYDELDELYGQVTGQWQRYMGHVVNNIGGVYETDKTYEQKGAVYEPVSREKQKEAMNFLVVQAFNTPTWLINRDILDRTNSSSAVNDIRSLQSRVLNQLLSPLRIGRLLEIENRFDKQTYNAFEMMDDVREAVWSELNRAGSIDIYRRNLQKAYLEQMDDLMTEEIPLQYARYMAISVDVSQSDIRAMVVDQLEQVNKQIQQAQSNANDHRATAVHLRDIERRIKNILERDE